MNWVDVVIIAVICFSTLLAFMRGLVREILGIGAWLASGFVAAWAFQYVQPRFHAWIAEKDIADLAAFGSVFVAALLVFSLISGFLASVVRTSVLGGLDRTLGMVFGVVRGAGALALAYIVAGLAVPLERWPDDVQDARTLPFVYDVAMLGVELLPYDYRPVVHVPPGVHETKAADLLHLNPLGRAVPPAVTR